MFAKVSEAGTSLSTSDPGALQSLWVQRILRTLLAPGLSPEWEQSNHRWHGCGTLPAFLLRKLSQARHTVWVPTLLTVARTGRHVLEEGTDRLLSKEG